MAQQQELEQLWKLAGALAEARKTQAKAQRAYLEKQKREQEQANKDNWFAPTLQGVASGALTGLLAGGGPIGALAGAGIGGTLGYAAHEQFNENPGLMPALGQAAVTGASLNRLGQPVSGAGPRFQGGRPDATYGSTGINLNDISIGAGKSLPSGAGNLNFSDLYSAADEYNAAIGANTLNFGTPYGDMSEAVAGNDFANYMEFEDPEFLKLQAGRGR